MKENAFLAAIDEHRGILIKICRTYFEGKQDQEDLFQEILLQLWKSLSRFSEKSKFSTWMYKVAINTALVYFKKEKKREEVLNQEGLFPSDAPEDPQVIAFYRGVKKLNKIEKALIIQYIDGLSGEEIANNMGISQVNVRVKINRTKLKLQTIIKDDGYEF